jgi:drug/metabolite transporter (DMT)-like permease
MFLALVKGIGAGAFNVGLALSISSPMPQLRFVGTALLVGFVGYGLSLVLFILALRHLGSARTAAHFATAPFFGSAVAILILKEPLTLQFGGAVVLMAIATCLVLTERHEHTHTHERLAHEHLHVHDEHHRHVHEGDEGPEPHTHVQSTNR